MYAGSLRTQISSEQHYCYHPQSVKHSIVKCLYERVSSSPNKTLFYFEEERKYSLRSTVVSFCRKYQDRKTDQKFRSRVPQTLKHQQGVENRREVLKL